MSLTSVETINISTLLQGADLLGKEGEVDVQTVLSSKLVALYFSAHWCPPCRGFTPVLAEFYNKLKQTGADWQVVFVSSDRDEKSFKDYYNEMPWLAIPFGDSRIANLKKAAQIQGIPTLIFLEPTSGKVLVDEENQRDGRDIVDCDDDNLILNWSLS